MNWKRLWHLLYYVYACAAKELLWILIILLNIHASVEAKNVLSCIHDPKFKSPIVCLIQAHIYLSICCFPPSLPFSIPDNHIEVFDHGRLWKLGAGGQGMHVFCLQMWCCACKHDNICEFDCNVVVASKPRAADKFPQHISCWENNA